MHRLVEDILESGPENVLFMIKMRPLRTYLGLITVTSSNDEPILVPAMIVQGRYKLKDGYKIQLECIYEGFGHETFYISDLTSIIQAGHAYMFVRPTDHFNFPNNFLVAGE